MATTATPDPLIPEGILTAVQTLAGTSAIALVNTGDRSLNAAISAFITTIVVYIIEKIKKFKKWSEFYELWTKLIDDLPIWKKTKKEEKVIDPLDVSGATNTSCLQHAIRIKAVDCKPLLLWISYHQPKVYCYSICRDVEINESKDLKIDEFESNYGITPPKIAIAPIYFNVKTKDFIYYNCISNDTVSLLCNLYSKSLDEFIEIVNKWYKAHKTPSTDLQLSLSSTQSTQRSLYKVALCQGKNEYVKKTRLVSRSFDGLFFEQKDILLEYLRKFKEGTLYPKHLREDNKLGILMYGPPGTGKSACMCAISELLQRDLMPVDGTSMRKRLEMDRIFACTDVVIAFDEFDCLLDVVGKRGEEREVDDDEKQSRREINTHSHKADMAAKLFTAALEEKDDAKKAQMMAEYDKLSNSSTDKVDMAYLLSKFQGYESAEGRCVVGSTNNPHLIDDALKRKGRFDLVLHLDNATPKMILDIVNYYYQTGAEEVAELEEAFMDLLPLRVISPACVQDMAMNCSSARETLERLIPKRR